MIRQISIGGESFRELREGGFELVDKTRVIEQVCGEAAKVLLLPRPRRFGKTVGLSMLREFFAIPIPGEDGKLQEPNARVLFQGLYLDRVWEKVDPHFQKYPTVLLNFKGMDFSTQEQWWEVISGRIASYARELSPLFGALDSAEKQLLKDFRNRTASHVQLGLALQWFTQWLHRGTGQKALVLIDEYDSPIQHAWALANALTPQAIARMEPGPLRERRVLEQALREDLYAQVINFFRAFLGNGLKGNDSLYKGIVTGILRISKESLFSDFNNPKVCTLMDTDYSDAFGFTEEEVRELFIRQEQLDRHALARQWYNGYCFGQTTLYNPWSILNYLSKKPPVPRAYWVNTSENLLIKQLLRRATQDTADDFEVLLRGGELRQPIRDALSLGDLARDTRGLFSLFYWSGYLTAELAGTHPVSGEGIFALRIPNREVRTLFQETFQDTLTGSASLSGIKVGQLTDAMLLGNDKLLQVLLSNLAVHLISYLDGDPHNPEAFYQGLMLGLCAWLEGDYKVRSNRETGFGRADLLILPKEPGKPGALLELKSTRYGESLDALLRQGEKQVKKRLYAAELEASGARPLQRWVVAFDGKLLKVKKLKAEG